MVELDAIDLHALYNIYNQILLFENFELLNEIWRKKERLLKGGVQIAERR